MTGFTLSNVCQLGLFTFLVCFPSTSFTGAVSFDLTELRNKVAKIKVNPRGNLWATGHFMGKKSVMDPPVLPSAEEQDADAQLRALAQLLQDLLRAASQAQTDAPQNRWNSQEADVLVKILETYVQTRK